MVPIKLTEEDKECIRSIGLDSGFKSVIKLMHNLVCEQYERVIGEPIEVGKEAKLIQLKCKADGARKLLGDLKRNIEQSSGRVTGRKTKSR